MEFEARKDIEAAGLHNAAAYDKRNAKRMKDPFSVGQLVKALNHRYAPGSRKLNANWEGPLRVTADHGNGTYTVKFVNDDEGEGFKLNATNLSPYQPKLVEVPPDSMEIEEIRKHRIREGSLEFLVSFVGLTHRKDKWRGPEEVNAPTLVRDYLRLLAFRSPEELESIRPFLGKEVISDIDFEADEEGTYRPSQAVTVSPVPSRPRRNQVLCLRCHRKGHNRNRCQANTDARAGPLDRNAVALRKTSQPLENSGHRTYRPRGGRLRSREAARPKLGDM
jgi:hypothetical protein